MTPPKNILYLTYDGLTDPLGQSQVLPYVKGLSKLGYKMHILSFEKEANLNAIGDLIKNTCDENFIGWTALKFHISPPVLSKYYDRYIFKKKAFKLHRIHQFDLIHCRGYISSEIGLSLKKKYNVPFLFDMRGLWADEKKDAGHWDVKKPIYRYIYNHYKRLEKEFIKHAAHIISLTSAGKKEMARLFDEGLKPVTSIDEKTSVIPCCADLDLFDYHPLSEVQRQQLKKQLSIPQEAPILTYNGSLGTWYLLEEMFLFFQEFKKQFLGAKFLILTKDIHELERYVKEGKISRDDLVVKFVQKKELPLYLSLGDASVFLIRNTYSKISSSPTKHAEIMGVGIPVFCNNIGDTGLLMEENKLGYLIEPGNTASYQAAISQFKIQNFSKENIRQTALENYDLKTGILKYEKVYENILA